MPNKASSRALLAFEASIPMAGERCTDFPLQDKTRGDLCKCGAGSRMPRARSGPRAALPSTVPSQTSTASQHLPSSVSGISHSEIRDSSHLPLQETSLQRHHKFQTSFSFLSVRLGRDKALSSPSLGCPSITPPLLWLKETLSHSHLGLLGAMQMLCLAPLHLHPCKAH